MKHINYGLGFRIKCRKMTWKERSFKEKILFWKTYTTALHPVTSEDLLYRLSKPISKKKWNHET